MLRNNLFFIHATALVAFLFLFNFMEASNGSISVGMVCLKAVLLYMLFILMTKAKWYFVLPAVGLLLLDQLIKRHTKYMQARGTHYSELQQQQHQRISAFLCIAVAVMILIGGAHYMWLQRLEYKHKFSYTKFFFGVYPCSARFKDYSKFRNPRIRSRTSRGSAS